MIRSSTAVPTALISFLATAASFAGPVDPPSGPVTSTGKALSDIEPRVPISQATTPGDSDSLFRITRPGSYYLPGDIVGVAAKNGIKVALGPQGGHVSIDMMGFSVRGVAGSLSGLVWEGPDLDASKCIWDLDNDGCFRDWGNYAILGRGTGRISGIRIESAGAGCLNLSAGGVGSTIIDHCTLRSTGGMAFANAPGAACTIRNSVIEGDGCSGTSLCYHGGPVMTGDTGVYLRNSTFSGSVIEVASTGSLTVAAGGLGAHFSGVSAASALHISPGSAPVNIMAHEAEEAFIGCTFSTAIFDIARDNSCIEGLNIHLDAATSAPAGVKLSASNSQVSGGTAAGTTAYLDFNPLVPVALEIVGSDNLVCGCHITSGAIGIRLTGSHNTVSSCILNKSGFDPITNIVIAAGSSGNLVIKSEFRNSVGGVSVSNLGGPSNMVAPMLTPADLAVATNPLANTQH